MGQIRQKAEAKTEIGPPLSDRALYSDKARSFNQSERALYRNFIIKLNSEIFPVLNVALVSYRDLNLQNANKMTSTKDFAIISTSIYNTHFTA